MSSEQMDVETSDDTQNKDVVHYGGCEGPDAEYVKLISSDEHEFIIKREAAMMSGTIRAMLSGPGNYAENETNIIRLRDINSHVLQKVCCFLNYKKYYQGATEDVPEFTIPAPVVLDLLMASNFLEC